jgi:hypothetical protein
MEDSIKMDLKEIRRERMIWYYENGPVLALVDTVMSLRIP